MTDGHEPLLSPEETSALLDAMRSGAEVDSVEPLDLTSAERPLRDALGTADACARAIAEALDKLMLRATGSPSSTEELPAEITPYKVIRSAIPQGAAIVPFRAPDGSLGVMTLGPSLVSFILDRRMGAPLNKEQASEPRASLSPLDRRLLDPFAISVVELFGKHWCDDAKAFTPSPVISQPADLPMLPQFEPLLQVVFRVAPTGLTGDQLVIALSSGIVSRARSTSLVKAPTSAPTEFDRSRMTAALGSTEVEAVALLGDYVSTVREVLGLRIGDIVRLSTTPDEPLIVRVGDKPVFLGVPVVHHGNIAVQIQAVDSAAA
ncbi:MAG TPA: FliM/FliN family flagellar motor switch protein [Polyangiales bacterium]|jgi:flagellar motor switch protein FliM|nr:FliM/FliN family flagellar motor switch protein [Polyangiales bacterium]